MLPVSVQGSTRNVWPCPAWRRCPLSFRCPWHDPFAMHHATPCIMQLTIASSALETTAEPCIMLLAWTIRSFYCVSLLSHLALHLSDSRQQQAHLKLGQRAAEAPQAAAPIPCPCSIQNQLSVCGPAHDRCAACRRSCVYNRLMLAGPPGQSIGQTSAPRKLE